LGEGGGRGKTSKKQLALERTSSLGGGRIGLRAEEVSFYHAKADPARPQRAAANPGETTVAKGGGSPMGRGVKQQNNHQKKNRGYSV